MPPAGEGERFDQLLNAIRGLAPPPDGEPGVVEFSGMQLESTDVYRVEEAIKHSVFVHTLVLEGCQIDDWGAESLARALQSNTELRTLRLAGNHITRLGATSLATVLAEKNCTLTALDLAGNPCATDSPDLAAAIDSALQRNVLCQEPAPRSPIFATPGPGGHAGAAGAAAATPGGAYSAVSFTELGDDGTPLRGEREDATERRLDALEAAQRHAAEQLERLHTLVLQYDTWRVKVDVASSQLGLVLGVLEQDVAAIKSNVCQLLAWRDTAEGGAHSMAQQLESLQERLQDAALLHAGGAADVATAAEADGGGNENGGTGAAAGERARQQQQQQRIRAEAVAQAEALRAELDGSLSELRAAVAEQRAAEEGYRAALEAQLAALREELGAVRASQEEGLALLAQQQQQQQRLEAIAERHSGEMAPLGGLQATTSSDDEEVGELSPPYLLQQRVAARAALASHPILLLSTPDGSPLVSPYASAYSTPLDSPLGSPRASVAAAAAPAFQPPAAASPAAPANSAGSSAGLPALLPSLPPSRLPRASLGRSPLSVLGASGSATNAGATLAQVRRDMEGAAECLQERAREQDAKIERLEADLQEMRELLQRQQQQHGGGGASGSITAAAAAASDSLDGLPPRYANSNSAVAHDDGSANYHLSFTDQPQPQPQAPSDHHPRALGSTAVASAAMAPAALLRDSVDVLLRGSADSSSSCADSSAGSSGCHSLPHAAESSASLAAASSGGTPTSSQSRAAGQGGNDSGCEVEMSARGLVSNGGGCFADEEEGAQELTAGEERTTAATGSISIGSGVISECTVATAAGGTRGHDSQQQQQQQERPPFSSANGTVLERQQQQQASPAAAVQSQSPELPQQQQQRGEARSPPVERLLASVEAMRSSASRIPAAPQGSAGGGAKISAVNGVVNSAARSSPTSSVAAQLLRSESGIPTPAGGATGAAPRAAVPRLDLTAAAAAATPASKLMAAVPGLTVGPTAGATAARLVAGVAAAGSGVGKTGGKVPPPSAGSPGDWSIAALHGGSKGRTSRLGQPVQEGQKLHDDGGDEGQQQQDVVEGLDNIRISPLLQMRISPLLDREDAADAMASLGQLSARMAALRDRIAEEELL